MPSVRLSLVSMKNPDGPPRLTCTFDFPKRPTVEWVAHDLWSPTREDRLANGSDKRPWLRSIARLIWRHAG